MGTVHFLPSLKSSDSGAMPPDMLSLVAAPPLPSVPPMNVEQRRFMTAAELAGRLGLDHHATRTVIDKLRALHRQAGLPLPRSPRIVRGVVMIGAASICWASKWDRGEALAWLDHGTTPPPAFAPAPAQKAKPQTRAILADRAAAMLPQRRVGA